MSVINYTWKIIEVDATARVLVVEYTADGVSESTKLNIGLPLAASTSLSTYVEQFAPIIQWKKSLGLLSEDLLSVSVGESGTASFDTEKAIKYYNWSEEELVALIKKTVA